MTHLMRKLLLRRTQATLSHARPQDNLWQVVRVYSNARQAAEGMGLQIKDHSESFRLVWLLMVGGGFLSVLTKGMMDYTLCDKFEKRFDEMKILEKRIDELKILEKRIDELKEIVSNRKAC
ncbi:hypothetical protein L211DRAFT_846305 [Terfezia boudieri ATCC MYA-4762]|uniref:Uncharacterized protein n=1 Tax=Terfezia boudieri ATCC MYA-4762 TaxID=1051890 RepID=A0A3N4LXA7_9PEZI|nr:hypothetical protein L211DRAFT_846305 [Terfezia boudieri ATCC MYA-4762]